MRDHTRSKIPQSSRTRVPAGAPVESPHALQLERGFKGLRFDAPLEHEFRSVFRAESQPQIRRNLWIALVIVVGFSWMTHLVLDAEVNRLMNQIRIIMFAPILGIGLLLVRLELYHRYYALACQVLAPIFGGGVAVLAVIAALHGVNLISTVVIMTIFIYFMLGMLFTAALVSALLVAASYLLAATIAGVPAATIIVDLVVLASANVIGAMVRYTMERTNRTNYLEEQLLIETASRDGLTAIHNRRYFDDHMDCIWLQAIREQAPLALLLIDIDHFKAYNDRYGHQAGDECLRRVAHSLTRTARRPLDVTARYGGEEFAIVLFDTRRDHVEELARRIQAGIESLGIEHAASPQSGRLTVSIGAACVQPQNGRSHFGFIQLADEALYAAKERGRNCVVVMDREYADLSTGSFRKSAGRSRV
ncbi:diguanylate cyclase [Povalibacter sp.]|uniref:GGDEF domain-containing protein n=1 Tax=Povalibacter sp. TaxID=1962978 RepID=UPI002F40E519